MKTKFFALFYGTMVNAEIVDKNCVNLKVEVAKVVTNIVLEHKRTWSFPEDRPLLSFIVTCNAEKLQIHGLLKAGQSVCLTTKCFKDKFEVTHVECEYQEAKPFNDFLKKVEDVP